MRCHKTEDLRRKTGQKPSLNVVNSNNKGKCCTDWIQSLAQCLRPFIYTQIHVIDNQLKSIEHLYIIFTFTFYFSSTCIFLYFALLCYFSLCSFSQTLWMLFFCALILPLTWLLCCYWSTKHIVLIKMKTMIGHMHQFTTNWIQFSNRHNTTWKTLETTIF